MAYATYTTEALVCGSRDSYTSDRSYLLFTKEAGMLWATARSVREEKSKQRCALQDFSFIRVSLVKGRSGWRIGSVEAVSNPFMKASSRSERAYVSSILSLLRRYIHGEQQMHTVFSDVKAALMNDTFKLNQDVAQSLFTARLLYVLGYISKNELTSPVLEAVDFEEAYELNDAKNSLELEKVIQQAHSLSHL